MTIPARYTLTEAHFKIVELERELAEMRTLRDAAVKSAQDWKDRAEAEHRAGQYLKAGIDKAIVEIKELEKRL